MKKIFALILLSLAIMPRLFAQEAEGCVLKLRLSDGTPLSVVIDGRRWQRQSRALVVHDLPPGMHRIKVFAAGFDDGYGNRTRPQLIYSGTLRLTPATFNLATINVERRSLAIRSQPLDDAAQPPLTDGPASVEENGYGTDRGHNAANPQEPGNPDVLAGGNSFTARDMDDLRARLAQRITDTDKESLLKSALENHSCTSDQVTQMLRMLSFESTRLDFCKWAYDHVTDHNNYWKLESAFDFSSSKEELSSFIKSQQ